MDKKKTGIIATIASTLLCGCPGLFGLCLGAITAFAGFFPGSDIDIFGSSAPNTALITGIVALCVSLLLIAIPIAVGFFTLRDKPDTGLVSDEPVPPAI